MQSWDIDPITGDYILDPATGRPKTTNSLRVPAYFRLKIKRTQWLYAPDSKYGSDYYTIQKRPAANANQRFENIAIKALQPIVDDGRASQVAATVEVNTRDSTQLDVEIVDATGEVEPVTFNGLGL